MDSAMGLAKLRQRCQGSGLQAMAKDASGYGKAEAWWGWQCGQAPAMEALATKETAGRARFLRKLILGGLYGSRRERLARTVLEELTAKLAI